MKKVCVVTATRAEYGLLYPLIVRLLDCKDLETQVVVTGAHLEEEFGNTYQEIERDGVPIYEKIPILAPGDDAVAVSRSMARAIEGFALYLKKEQPDFLVLLGDRTELLGIAAAAMNQQVPIAHIHGGELTQGAVDDSVRHALTKMSYLHFTSAEQYQRRVIQLGEEPERVFNTGALGVENILRQELLTRKELKEAAEFPADRDYAVVTFHPVTREVETARAQVRELFAAMEQKRELFYLITKANSDAGGRQINAYMEQETAKHSNMKLVASLGMKRYLSAVKYARFVLGNSSSGVIEAPSFGVPTVNIGDRQQGRIMGESIVNCEPDCTSIGLAIDRAMEMGRVSGKSPYGNGTASEQMVAVLREYLFEKPIQLKKKFYDLE